LEIEGIVERMGLVADWRAWRVERDDGDVMEAMSGDDSIKKEARGRRKTTDR